VIPSARFSNLKGCVESILENEPGCTPKDILVVDDGASLEAPKDFPVTWIPGTKPFVFARNANLGIMKACENVVLMNDDARLRTPKGFSKIKEQDFKNPGWGVISPSIRGVVGNPEQQHQGVPGIREARGTLAFICVYISFFAIAKVGMLDDRFTAYGGDDMDYCRRTKKAGFKLGIFDDCMVTHDEAPSTFRTKPEIYQLFLEGKRQYDEKVALEEGR
jgi:GT2 family glycosyltransferase